MPRTRTTPLAFNGPYRGINDLVSPRQLAPGEFVDLLNCINVAGRIGPRPGYVKARTQPMQIGTRILLTLSGSGSPADVAVTPDGSKVFWSKNFGSGVTVRSAPLPAGTPITDVASIVSPQSIEATNSHFIVSVSGKITRYTHAGASATDLVDSLGYTPNSISYDGTQYIYWTRPSGGTGVEGVYRADITGSLPATPALVYAVDDPRGIVAKTTAARFFVVAYNGDSTSSVHRANLDGSSPEVILTGLVSNGGTSVDRIDLNGTDLFVTETTPTIIRVPNAILGTPAELAAAKETLATHPTLTVSNGLAVDPSTGILYFAETVLDEMKYLFGSSSGYIIVSAFPLERSLIGVEGVLDDVVLFQALRNPTSGTADDETFYGIWFPATDETYILPLGYTAASGDAPAMFVTNDRDADPISGALDWQTGFGRAHFSYQGIGLNTARGGVSIGNGEGRGHVFNYVMGNHKVRLTWTTAGEIRLTVNGIFVDFDDDDSERVTREAIQNSGITGYVIVDRSGTGIGATCDIEFLGAMAGRDAEVSVATTPGDTGEATLTVLREGGTEEEHIAWLRPMGLPRPIQATNGIWIDTGTLASTLDGLYSYRFAWYSSTLGIESPVSIPLDANGAPAEEYVQVPDTDVVSITIEPTAIPDTMYFKGGNVPFLVCDKLRIYRRRWGSAASATPDYTGVVDDTWYLVREADVQGILDDLVSAGGSAITITDNFVSVPIKAPTYDYPPERAQFVCNHGQRTYYMALSPAEQRIHYSELPNPITAELGYEYVNIYSNAVIENPRPSDHHATGMFSYRDTLLAFTNHDVFRVGTDLLEFGDLRVERIAGGAGCASQWCIVETEALPELGGRLVWPNAQGALYEFNGAEVNLLSRPIQALVRRITKKTWANLETPEHGTDSWYWASGLLDSDGYRVIISTFMDAPVLGGPYEVVQLVFDLDTQSWGRWNIPGWGWFPLRTFSGHGKGTPLVIFSNYGAQWYQLQRGKADDGTVFDAEAIFGKDVLGALTSEKDLRTTTLLFEVDRYGGDDPEVVLESDPDNADNPVSKSRISDAGYFDLVSELNLRCRHIQHTVLWPNVADDQDQAFLVGHENEIEVIGPR